MATQVNSIYLDVTNTLLEDGGFTTLGIMGVGDFLNMLKDVLQDFIMRTGMIKRLVSQVALYGVGTYVEPDNTVDVQAVHFDNTYVSESSGWYMDNFNPQWQSQQGFPERW